MKDSQSKKNPNEREQAILEAMKRLAEADDLNIPSTIDIGLGTRDEIVKVRVTVLRASASNGKLIKAESEVLEQDWNTGPYQFGISLSRACADLARKVWPVRDPSPENSGFGISE